MDPVFEFLKLLLCCDVALSSPITIKWGGCIGFVSGLCSIPGHLRPWGVLQSSGCDFGDDL